MNLGKTNISVRKSITRVLFTTFILLTLSTGLSLFLQANKSEETPLTTSELFGIKNYDNYNALDLSSEYLYQEDGGSSWYGPRFHNHKTSSGELYNMYAYSAAHKSLPFGTIVKVTNNQNNMSTFVRINDRGPFTKGRIIDLSFTSRNDIDPIGNPDIKIEALLPKTSNVFDDTKIEYFFGYSLTSPLVCLPYSNFKVVETIEDFSIAVEKYKSLSEKNIDKNFYLIVPANSSNPNAFMIAYLDTNNDEPFSSEFANN